MSDISTARDVRSTFGATPSPHQACSSKSSRPSTIPIVGGGIQLTFSSFMGGGGSELLIASVFEAGPPIDFAAATSKKASKEATKTGSDAETSDSDGDDKAGLATVFAMGRTKNPRKKGAKGPRGKQSTKRNKKEEDIDMREEKIDGGNGDEVQRLKHELKMVRESQLRTEEMIAKLLSGPK